MTTIADLLAMRAAGAMTGTDAELVLFAFLARFDVEVASELAATFPQGSRMPAGASVETLLEASDDKSLDVLARLIFDGGPVALVRGAWLLHEAADDDRRRDSEAVVHLVDRLGASELVYGCVEAMRKAGNDLGRLRETDCDAAADDLLRFRPRSAPSLGGDAPRVRDEERIAFLHGNWDGVDAVLTRIAGAGCAVIKSGPAGGRSVYPDGRDAVDAFMAELTATARERARARNAVTILSLQDRGRSGVGLAEQDGALVCKRIVPEADAAEDEQVIEASGAQALPTFLRIARTMLAARMKIDPGAWGETLLAA